MWASEHWKTVPDIMCLAKGIAGGVPMGATLVRPDILAVMKKGEHSSTFGGNPLACALQQLLHFKHLHKMAWLTMQKIWEKNCPEWFGRTQIKACNH